MNKLTIPVSLFILLVFMSFRGVSVGADTIQYIYGFKQIVNSSFGDLFSFNVAGYGGGILNYEFGYRVFNKLVSFISTDDQAITIANSLIIIILLGILLKKRSLIPILSIWLYITLGVFQTQMNMSRNAIAILFCYLGFKYIEEKKLIKFLAFIILGAFFHVSVLLFIPFYWIVLKVKLSSKLLFRVLFIAVVLGLGFTIVRPYVIRVLPYAFAKYFMGNTHKYESLIIGVFHLVLVLSTWFFLDKKEKFQAIENQKTGMWMFIGEIFFFCVGYNVSAASRMAALFGPFLILLIPNMLYSGIESEQKRNRIVYFIMLFSGVQYILRLMINNIGSTMPYQFFWS